MSTCRSVSWFALFLWVLLAMPQTSLAVPPAALQSATDHPKFVEALPVPDAIDATDGGAFEMEMREVSQWLGLRDTNDQQLDTTVWGYGRTGDAASYPGPTFVAREGVPISVHWKNELPNANVAFPGSHLLAVDPRVHIAHPGSYIAATSVR